MITDEQLEAWETLAGEATEGPWVVVHEDDDHSRAWRDGRVRIDNDSGQTVVSHWAEYAGDAGLTLRQEDGTFIVAARFAVPALIAEVRRARKVEAALREEMKRATAEKERLLRIERVAGAALSAIALGAPGAMSRATTAADTLWPEWREALRITSGRVRLPGEADEDEETKP